MRKSEWIMVVAFLLVTLLLSSPFIFRFVKIHEIYVYSEVRDVVFDSVLFVREVHGTSLADVKIKDVFLRDDDIYIVVNEHYVGFIDRDDYDDVDVDYLVRYDTSEGVFSEVE